MAKLIKRSDIDSLLSFEGVKAEIEKIETIDIAKAFQDRAEILRIYAKKVGKGLEVQNRCAEIKIRAEKKAGELLKVIPREKSREYQKLHDVTFEPKPSLSELGITNIQSHRWLLINS
ncbi:unnamed protein product, partial [marine sediment metagenome]